MSKLTKKQRRERRKKKKIQIKRRRAEKKSKKAYDLNPWERPRMKMFQFENPFPPEIPREKRIEIINAIGEKHQKIFEEQYQKLEDWFEKYDALYVLSFCSLYFTAMPEGIDPEASGKIDFYHHYLEILQAFSLRKTRNLSLEPLKEDANKLFESTKAIGEAIGLRHVKLPEGCDSDEKINTHKLRIDMMTGTTAVRNWAYNHQMELVTLEIADLVESDFEKLYKLNPRLLFSALFKTADQMNERLNEHLNKLRKVIKEKNHKKMMEAYNKAFPDNSPIDEESMEQLWEHAGKNIKNLGYMIMAHSDLRLPEIYSLGIDELATLYGDKSKTKELGAMMGNLSYEFGALKNNNPEHFILANPVHLRPFINVEGNSFFSAVLGIIKHLSLGILENLISANSDLKEKYENIIKPNYLEEKLSSLFQNNFPHASIHKNVRWHNDQDDKDYETDLVVVIDNFILVVEAKAGHIPSNAQRGEPVSLFRTLQRLIEDPSEQSHRFIEYLKMKRQVHKLSCAGGRCEIDSSKLNYFIPLGVTFSHMGMISSNLKKLIKAKVTRRSIKELAPSISLTDLESVFELLTLESEKIHYLERRREIEDHVEYEGDELDLLSFYLDNGFNIGEAEYKDKVHINMLLKSKELDPYFVGSNEGVVVEKPSLEMTDWWRDILTFLVYRKAKNWMETSFILLSSTKKDQEEFIKMFKILCEKVKKGKVKQKHNWVSFQTGPEQRRFLIIGYPYTGISKEERNNVMMEILHSDEAEKSRGVAIIGLNLDRRDYPYSVMSGRLDTNLFDI